MRTTLDAGTGVPWDAVVAGAALPSLTLTLEIIIIATQHGFGAFTWLSTSWLVVLLLAFAIRYRTGKVASLAWEFHFGMWLGCAPIIILGLALNRERYKWIEIAVFAFAFIFNLVRYVRLFHLSTDTLKAES
jgi:hypothetical protein